MWNWLRRNPVFTNKRNYRNRDREIWAGFGVESPKHEHNCAAMWRAGLCLGIADMFFTIGAKYDHRTHADVMDTNKCKPCINFTNFEDFYRHRPNNCELVAVEIGPKAIPLEQFRHPARAVYVMGGETVGLSKKAQQMCRHKIVLPIVNGISMNLATCGAMVMWDRFLKMKNQYE